MGLQNNIRPLRSPPYHLRAFRQNRPVRPDPTLCLHPHRRHRKGEDPAGTHPRQQSLSSDTSASVCAREIHLKPHL